MEAAFKHRYCGGVNLIFFGDWWQLPPVGDVAIMSNPFRGPALLMSKIQKMMSIFWTKGRECLNGMIELTVNKRSGTDAWLSAVIDECRSGDLHWEN